MENKDFDTFLQEMKKRVVVFKFRKKNGDIREAKGTKSFESIPQEKYPQGVDNRVKPIDTYTYFDVEKDSWRSFKFKNFISFNEE